MSLTITQLRLLVLSRRRFITDAVAWLMLYLLLALFVPMLLWHQFMEHTEESNQTLNAFFTYILDSQDASAIPVAAIFDILQIVVKDVLWFGIWLVPVVYLNLFVLKNYILDREPPRAWRYPLYLAGVILIAAFFAGAMIGLERFVGWTRTIINFPFILLLNVGIALISTGLVYRKELLEQVYREWRIEEMLEEELAKANEELKKIDVEVTPDHLKVGTKNNYEIIRFEEIIYFKGAGNEPFIWTTRGRFYGNYRMLDYEEQLPAGEFIRIHRSYIIAKKKVLSRKENKFILPDGKGGRVSLPIGESYLKPIEADGYLGHNQIPVVATGLN